MIQEVFDTRRVFHKNGDFYHNEEPRVTIAWLYVKQVFIVVRQYVEQNNHFYKKFKERHPRAETTFPFFSE